MKTKIKPLVSWSIWAGGLSLVMGFVTRDYLIEGFRADNTGMSVVIAAVFTAGLVISFVSAFLLHSEWKVLKQVEATNTIPASDSEGHLASVLNKLATYKEKGEIIDIHAAIDTYHTKHNSRARSVSIMAALVISMGLLGTVVGLIMSISGLGGMVENIGLSRTTMMGALKTTVAGMGTAFYTTFFGALGGLILRAVAVSQQNALAELCSEATEYADTHLTARFESKEEELQQKLAQIIASFNTMQTEIEAVTSRLSDSFDTTMHRFGDALTAAGEHAMETTRDCMSGMSEQITLHGREVGASFSSFNTAIEQSGEQLCSSFEDMNRQLGEAGDGVSSAFAGLNESVKESGSTVAASLADFKLSLDGTTSELQDAVRELHTAIGEATGEIKTLSQARLDAEASEIAGHLSVAAASIQQFLSQKPRHDENQKVA